MENNEGGQPGWIPYLELPNERGVITGGIYGSLEEAHFAATELILSWN